MRQNGRGSYLLDVVFANGRKTEITVDSGAEESVCPWEWGRNLRLIMKGKRWFFVGQMGLGSITMVKGKCLFNRLFEGGTH